MLESLLLSKNSLSRRIEFRSYQPDAKNPNDEYYRNKKLEYEISQSEQNVDKALERMQRRLARQSKKE